MLQESRKPKDEQSRSNVIVLDAYITDGTDIVTLSAISAQIGPL